MFPALLGRQPFLRFYGLAEHHGRVASPLIYENTRTMTGTNAVYRKLAWNMPYHAQHHAWPAVPFYKLPEVHRLWTTRNDDGKGTTTSSSNQELLDRGERLVNEKYLHRGYVAFHVGLLKGLWTKTKKER
jgi:fatty acid desaturase